MWILFSSWAENKWKLKLNRAVSLYILHTFYRSMIKIHEEDRTKAFIYPLILTSIFLCKRMNYRVKKFSHSKLLIMKSISLTLRRTASGIISGGKYATYLGIGHFFHWAECEPEPDIFIRSLFCLPCGSQRTVFMVWLQPRAGCGPLPL